LDARRHSNAARTNLLNIWHLLQAGSLRKMQASVMKPCAMLQNIVDFQSAF